jgi:phosphoribosylamine--glycine ligase
MAAARGALDAAAPATAAAAPAVAVGVVLASAGYPGAVETGVPIAGIDEADAIPDVEVLHAATTRRGGGLVTSGGRVLTVVGRGPSFDVAIARAYDGVARISFEGMQYRRDIGRKALQAARG